VSINNSLNINGSSPLIPAWGGTGVSNGTNTLTIGATSYINQDVRMTATPLFSGVMTGAINDYNDNNVIAINGVSSAVNYIEISNNSTGNAPYIKSLGSDTNIGLSFSTQGTGVMAFATTAATDQYLFYSGTAGQHTTYFSFPSTGAQRTVTFPDASGTLLMTGQAINTVPSIAFSTTSGVIGTTTNDDAASGSVGEYIYSEVFGSPVSLTTNTVTDLTSITLSAGDWDVCGNVYFSPVNSTVVESVAAWVSSTSATMPNGVAISRQDYGTPGSTSAVGVPMGLPIATRRYSLATSTIIYISGISVFTISTMSIIGFISARRVR